MVSLLAHCPAEHRLRFRFRTSATLNSAKAVPQDRAIICASVSPLINSGTAFLEQSLPTITRSVMEATSPLFDQRPAQHRVRHQIFKQRSFSLLLALFAVASLAVTIFFAYNCSLPQPLSSKLMFQNPSRSILVLNFLSQITMFCLSELAFCVLSVLGWVFASHPSGTPAYTFLALSRATNLAGVLSLIVSKGPEPGRLQPDGHRVWGIQRYISL